MCTAKKKEPTRLTNKHERRRRKIDLVSLSLSLYPKGYIKMSKIMIKKKKKKKPLQFLFLLT
jgi:hypothetical protein